MTTLRRLILLRHAKSAEQRGMPDRERPLNSRGLHDAPRVGAELIRLRWTPDLVYCSDATRTRQTWSQMAATVGTPADRVTYTDQFYLTGLSEIRRCAVDWPDTANTVLCIGHNFGWEEAVTKLTGANEQMTTCNAACMEGHGERWTDALAGRFTLIHMVRPKDL